jgi:hypothetical protein
MGATARLAAAVIAAAGFVAGCDVETYDDAVARIPAGSPPPPSGSPPPPPPPPPPAAGFGPNFSEIQANVFTPDCATSGCHAGGNPAAGLSLAEADSYAMLVGIQSGQDAALQRVEAGDPDNSYLVQKLEGTASSGQQMPPGSPLPQSEIDVIRQWITDGAMDDRVVVLDPITVTSLSPMPNAALDAPPANIVAGFSRELNQATVNATTFLLTASGGDGTFADGNEIQVSAAAISVPAANPQSAVFDLTGVALADDTYRVQLLGGATNAILELDGNALDGEFFGNLPSGNGVAGGDFTVLFTITSPVTIGPTLPQIQAVVFTPKCASCHNGVGAALPGVLNLSSETASLASLVNVASIQDPAIDRVEPGQPDNSYLVHKIDGTAASQMPPSGPLSQAEIDAIRQWILDLPPSP